VKGEKPDDITRFDGIRYPYLYDISKIYVHYRAMSEHRTWLKIGLVLLEVGGELVQYTVPVHSILPGLKLALFCLR
jgi:hypothetical protein